MGTDARRREMGLLMNDDADAAFHDDLDPAAPVWPLTVAHRTLPARLVAEAVGTFALVGVGLGAVLLVQPFNQHMTLIPGLAFGLALFVVTVALQRVSGAHVNPAVTLGMWAAGRFPGRDIAAYVLAQVAGGLVGGAAVLGIAALQPGAQPGRAVVTTLANGWGNHSPWHVSVWGVLAIETAVIAAFVAVVLATTSVVAEARHAPVAIGATFGALVTLTIPLTNGAVNPARSTAAAVFAESWALGQLWAWWLAAAVAGVAVGLAFRAFGPAEDLEPAKDHPAAPTP